MIGFFIFSLPGPAPPPTSQAAASCRRCTGCRAASPCACSLGHGRQRSRAAGGGSRWPASASSLGWRFLRRVRQRVRFLGRSGEEEDDRFQIIIYLHIYYTQLDTYKKDNYDAHKEMKSLFKQSPHLSICTLSGESIHAFIFHVFLLTHCVGLQFTI